MHITNYRLARILRGRTARDVARETGLDVCRLSRIETGAMQPRHDEVERIAAALDLPVQWLMGPVAVRLPRGVSVAGAGIVAR